MRIKLRSLTASSATLPSSYAGAGVDAIAAAFERVDEQALTEARSQLLAAFLIVFQFKSNTLAQLFNGQGPSEQTMKTRAKIKLYNVKLNNLRSKQ